MLNLIARVTTIGAITIASAYMPARAVIPSAQVVAISAIYTPAA